LISTNYILSITNNQGSILTTQGLFGEVQYIDISQEFIDNSLKKIDIKLYFLETCHIINKIMRQNEMRPFFER
jgi:hypothetical protein